MYKPANANSIISTREVNIPADRIVPNSSEFVLDLTLSSHNE